MLSAYRKKKTRKEHMFCTESSTTKTLIDSNKSTQIKCSV